MQNIRQIEWNEYGSTLIHPVSLGFTGLMCALIFKIDRRYILLPLLATCCLMPNSQRVVVADFDFSMIRLVILAGWLRILVSGDYRSLKLVTLDKAFLIWVITATVFRVLRDMSMGAFIYRVGYDMDALGVYFLVRTYVRSPADLVASVKVAAFLTVPVAGAMTIEWITGRNPFAFLGGIREFTEIRNGRLRCVGALGHPILAGSFGASLVPLFIGLFLSSPKNRLYALMGMGCATIITITTASSGPALCWLAGLAAWGVWTVREYLRPLRWLITALLVFVHFIREKPVWHLIGRLAELIGGTGYHRVRLIDSCIRHFGEWWLRGTHGTAYWGWGLQDTTNWYVANATNGGLATLLSFVAVVVVAFKTVGQTMARLRESAMPRASSRRLQYLVWGLGASLTTHMMAWISVSYFGQMQKIFFMQLALTATLATFATVPVQRQVPVRRKTPTEKAKDGPLEKADERRRGGRKRMPSLRDLIGASQRSS